MVSGCGASNDKFPFTASFNITSLLSHIFFKRYMYFSEMRTLRFHSVIDLHAKLSLWITGMDSRWSKLQSTIVSSFVGGRQICSPVISPDSASVFEFEQDEPAIKCPDFRLCCWTFSICFWST